jgi:hypothetical protein
MGMKTKKNNFFKPSILKIVIFILIVLANLYFTYINFFNRCGGLFCAGGINSFFFVLLSPFLALASLYYINLFIFLLLLGLSIIYNYLLACLIGYLFRGANEK